jgi:CRISPR system Cascade subunit CasD
MVLVARLAGPLQSWGAEPKLKTATTHPTPTWSGVRGLLRAALGHSRDANPADVAWLDELTVAIRVDSPGTVLVDYHTKKK